jgi:hypothetical protein
VHWTGREFERWFVDRPVLPGDEKLLIVARARPIDRVVDLVCLDAEGGLVVIEVTSEPATRRTVGQALEHLATYEEAVVGDLGSEFESCFGRRLDALSKRRRVVLAAPAFDPSSARAIAWLNEKLTHASIEFRLLEVTAARECFLLKWYETPRVVRSGSLPAGAALSPDGKAFQVMLCGKRPVVWHVGQLDPITRTITMPTGAALSRRAVRLSGRHLSPSAPFERVDLGQSGSVWKHRYRDSCAHILGTVTERNTCFVVFVRTRRGFPTRVRRQSAVRFRASWQIWPGRVTDWGEMAAALERDRNRHRRNVRG